MKLSELECAVLGVVWRMGPCSAYAVRKEFEQATSSWSSGPGTIYPVISRLEAADFIAGEDHDWGERGKRLYRATKAGLKEIRAWVCEVPDWTGAPPTDPLRSRAFFLDALADTSQRRAFVARAIAVTTAAITELRQAMVVRTIEEDGRYGKIALAGALLQLKAKLRWLRQVERLLESERS